MSAGEPFEIFVANDAGTVTVALAGEVDLAAESSIVDHVARALSAGSDVTSLRVDLSSVTFLDSSGLRGLIQIRQLADARDVKCTLTVVDGAISRLFDLTGLGDYFSFDPPRPAAD